MPNAWLSALARFSGCHARANRSARGSQPRGGARRLAAAVWKLGAGVLRRGGRAELGALPLEIGSIRQDIEQQAGSGGLQAQNIIEVLPPLSSPAAAAGLPLPRVASEYSIGAECERLGPTRVGLVFARASLRPYGLPDGVRLEAGLPQVAVEALQRLTKDVVYLETTYLDEDLRIARGPNREIYALSRNRAA